MSSAHGNDDEAMYAGEGRHGKQENPEHRRSARGKAGGVIIGLIVVIFLVLLTIWLLGRSADEVESAPASSGGGAPAVVLVADG